MRYDYWKFQLCKVEKGERPEYEDKENPNWETILDASTAEELLCGICDWLNDEEYPTDEWVRVVKGNDVIASGLHLNGGKNEK